MCSVDASAWPKRQTPASLTGRSGLAGLGIGCVLFCPWLVVWWLLCGLPGYPANDDPFYAKPLATWSAQGRIQFVRQNGFLTASSAAHIVTGSLAVLAGFDYRNLYLVCIVQQAAGASALFWLARRLQHSPWTACFVAACLTTHPLYFGHAFTFMTDGPAAAWSSVACVLLSLGLIGRSSSFVILGALAVGWGYWIRQTNAALLIVPGLVLGLNLWKRDGQGKHLAWSLGLALLLIAVFESGWLLPTTVSRLRDIAPQPTEGYWRRTLIAVYGWLLIVGWYVLPLAPWLASQAWYVSKRSDPMERTLCSLGAGLTLLAGAIPFGLTLGRAYLTNATGNFIQNGHLGPVFLSDMDDPGRWGTLAGVQWPAWCWQVLTLLSIFSATSLGWWASWSAVSFARQWRTTLQPFVLTSFAWLVMLAVSVSALALFVEPHLDRYWLFLLPIVSVFCLLVVAHHRPQFHPIASVWAIAWLMLHMVMSTIFVHDMLAWNATRWTYVQQHLADGHAAQTIDAGRDVNAWLRMDEDPDTSARPGDTSRWWSGHAMVCIASGPRPGWQLLEQLPWHSWATGQTHYLFVLQRSLDTR